jgi:sterol desaturase/sphingolipid hydroxylase (fatty acid hydroxylase superfamily)
MQKEFNSMLGKRVIAGISLWVLGSSFEAELLGYWLHRLLHSGRVRSLSRGHMEHHLEFYGPLQHQRPSTEYLDATNDRIALGNIGLEWLVPSGLLLAMSLGLFWLLGIRALYQAIYVAVVLIWSFVSFSYLHDRMHVQNFWMERNRWTRWWFRKARRLHDVHHRTLNDDGKMDRNFGIGFFFFDWLFGTLALEQRPFNRKGYEEAKRRSQMDESH